MGSQLRGSFWSGQRRLTLESLESRWNPSTVRLQGDTLVIIGTQSADTVAIVDDGQGGIEVTFDNTARGGGHGGGSNGSDSGSGSNGSDSNGSDSNGDNGNGGNGGTITRTFTGVEEVIFLGLRGDDTFTYDLTGPLTTRLELDLRLGGGNDLATINASEGIETDGRLRVEVDGGRGDDEVVVDLGSVADDARFNLNARLGGGDDLFDVIQVGDIGENARVATRIQAGGGDDVGAVSVEGDVAETATLAVRLDGGRGDDDLTALFTGELDGELRLNADGGGGGDTVAAEVDLVGESTGEVRARVLGGKGGDDLTLNIFDPEELATLGAANLNGGAGTDTATATDNVMVRNVP